MCGFAVLGGPYESRSRVNLPEGLAALLHQPCPCFLTTLLPGGSALRRPGEGRRVEAMDVRLFGQLEAADGGVAFAVRGAKQRALLALLALHRGEPVSADRLIDVLWGDGLAAKPANALQAQIGQLRRTLGAGAIVTTEAGYALAVGPDEVDVVRFEQLVAKGRRLAEAGEMAQASAALGEALGLRRGEPLAEFAYSGFADTERAQLDELTLVAIETRAGADLVLGRHGELAGELEARCRQHPLRERLWELLILALYRAGRQADALRAYTEVRDRLAGELGIDPGPALRELQARILAQDPSLAAAAPAPVRAAAPAAAGNLRERLSSFIGRDAELEQLLGSVRASRLVTLTGPGGTGKTRLAVEAAAALRAEYQDGAWLVELAGVAAPDGVGPAVAGALGAVAAALGGPQPPGSAVQLIVRHLAGRSLVVVLDNCEHVIAEAAALADTVAGAVPGLRLIATSREALGIPGEVLVPVGGLAIPAAVELFADRARAVQPGFLAGGWPATSSRTSAAGWTACPWPSSSPPPGSVRCRWPPWRNGSTTASGCSPAAPAPRCPASRPCGRWWTGATTCCSRTNAACSPGWPPAPAAAISPQPKLSAPTTRSRPVKSSMC